MRAVVSQPGQHALAEHPQEGERAHALGLVVRSRVVVRGAVLGDASVEDFALEPEPALVAGTGPAS